MNAEKPRWINRLDFAMLTMWLMLSVILAIISFVLFGQDFRGYYAAARVLLAGGNPYDYHLVAQVLLDVTGEMGNNPYYYPPWFSWLFIPVAFLPFQIARAIWMMLNVILWNLGLLRLGEAMAWPPPGWRRYALFALATFSFAWITWRYEQAGILVFFMFVELIQSIHSQKWKRAGIWMALLLVKPNITLIALTGISLWLLRKGQWRPVLVMLLTLAVLLSISTAITPNWFQPFTEEGFGRGLTAALDGPDEVVAIRINTTFLDWLRTLGIEPRWNRLLYGIAICIGVIVYFWSVYRAPSFVELTSVLLLVSYAITPYVLQYDYPPLVITLFWALARCTSKAFTVGLAIVAFVFSVIFWQQNISWAYWMVVGLVALAVWSIVQRKTYSEGIANNS
jgi:hypothetical protein